ncbi:hypothetical protein QBC44DRAFT_335088 [Cladorrhinum sp. PSN332]|nr:hypothetical protein QBC44DRAFT_335088 [Cladorrhinum sp. PSN332]
MSGVEVVGLIGAVLGILDVAVKAYDGLKGINELPNAYREAGSDLPLIRNTLEIAKEHLDGRNITPDETKAIKPAIESCQRKAERLTDILEDVSPAPHASIARRAILKTRMIGKRDDVKRLMDGILQDVILLASNRTMSGPTWAQVNRDLQQALQQLRNMGDGGYASNATGQTFTFYDAGSGTHYNNAGSGTQSNHSGSGGVFNLEGGNVQFHFGRELDRP